MRLLFASVHSYLDPSSGAALATREMLELLAGRGMDCRVLSAGVLDHEQETSLDDVLATLELPARRFQAELRGSVGRRDRSQRQWRPGDAHAHGVQPRRTVA